MKTSDRSWRKKTIINTRASQDQTKNTVMPFYDQLLNSYKK